MTDVGSQAIDYVIGSLGERLTVEDLPAGNRTRWVPRGKAQLVSAINGGLINFEEATIPYRLSLEELTEWMRWESRFGLQGLRAMKLQQHKAAIRLEHG
jgi:hypothetical protein